MPVLRPVEEFGEREAEGEAGALLQRLGDQGEVACLAGWVTHHFDPGHSREGLWEAVEDELFDAVGDWIVTMLTEGGQAGQAAETLAGELLLGAGAGGGNVAELAGLVAEASLAHSQQAIDHGLRAALRDRIVTMLTGGLFHGWEDRCVIDPGWPSTDVPTGP